MDGIILNIPAMFAGLPQEAYLSEFIPTAAEEAMEEDTGEEMVDEFGITAEQPEVAEDTDTTDVPGAE